MKSTIILFWSNFNKECKDFTTWKNSELVFSPFHKLTLRSHEKLNNTVELWTFQKVSNFDYKNITIKDASKFMEPEKAFDSLQKGHSIAFVSDAIRLKRAAEIEGIVLDMDAVVLKKFPEYDSWFSTFPSRKEGAYAPIWGDTFRPMKIHDNSWDGKAYASFPIKVGSTTKKQIDELADKIIDKLQAKITTQGKLTDRSYYEKLSREWNMILWTVKDIANSDTTAKIFESIYFCPVPPWLHNGNCYSIESPTRLDGQTQAYGHTLPSVEEIFEKSYCVQHFFESAFNKSSVIDDIAINNISLNCLLKKEINHYFDDWKQPYEILFDEN